MSPLPVVGITMGDPAGVGPEIIVRALRRRKVRSACRAVVFGRSEILAAAADKLGRPFRAEAFVEAGGPVSRLPRGRPSVTGGRASLAAIESAMAATADGRIDAVVTSPINKEAIRKAGSPWPGHTEMIAAMTGTRSFAMMLVGGGLRVSLATIHVPLREVPSLLGTDRIVEVIGLTAASLPALGVGDGTVGVCGLNPHAGEGGIMGDEDRHIVAPAVRRARRRGIRVAGPLPADTIFHRSLRGDFAAVVAMYHDQGLIPLKTLAFDSGVNLTLGLPVIRTSVDHGTAYDIAGGGRASDESLVAAILLAADLARRRTQGRGSPR